MGLGMRTISRQALLMELWEGVMVCTAVGAEKGTLAVGWAPTVFVNTAPRPPDTHTGGREKGYKGTACFLHISLTLCQVQCHMTPHH